MVYEPILNMGHKHQIFKTKGLGAVLVYILIDRELCSKEISMMFIGKDYNNRNILKYLNGLEKEGLIKFLGIGLKENYGRSKFFTTDKDRLTQTIIDDIRKSKENDELEAKRLQAEPHRISVPSSKREALNLFLNYFHTQYREEEKATYIFHISRDSNGNETGNKEAIARLKGRFK